MLFERDDSRQLDDEYDEYDEDDAEEAKEEPLANGRGQKGKAFIDGSLEEFRHALSTRIDVSENKDAARRQIVPSSFRSTNAIPIAVSASSDASFSSVKNTHVVAERTTSMMPPPSRGPGPVSHAYQQQQQHCSNTRHSISTPKVQSMQSQEPQHSLGSVSRPISVAQPSFPAAAGGLARAATGSSSGSDSLFFKTSSMTASPRPSLSIRQQSSASTFVVRQVLPPRPLAPSASIVAATDANFSLEVCVQDNVFL